jgi:prevent-host-death family protein
MRLTPHRSRPLAPRAGRRIGKGKLRKLVARAKRVARTRRPVALPPSLEMGATEFKALCLQLMDEVKRTGKSVVITKRGKPVAQLTPPPPPKKRKSVLGCMAGTFEITGDIVSPATPTEETMRLLHEEWDEIERISGGGA